MRDITITIPLLSILTLLTPKTHAQLYPNQSAPFNLYLTSADPSINGTTLSACHTGAALESLCLSTQPSPSKPDPLPPATFYFNTSSDPTNIPNTTLGVPGIITYQLPTADLTIPSSLDLTYDPTTNIALPLLSPGDSSSIQLSFEPGSASRSAEELVLWGYVDWSTDPPTPGEYKGYKRWWACRTYFLGYEYLSLAWGLGGGRPEGKGCVGVVGVRRVFIEG